MAIKSSTSPTLFEVSSPTKQIEVYTDGSCLGNPGPGGWAAILVHGDHERVLIGSEAQTTNNRMELQAVLEAVRALKQPCRVAICTDSQLVIGWLHQGWKRRNPELAAMCLEIEALVASGGHVLDFDWVRGHNGHAYNERVDRLARDAARGLVRDATQAISQG
jgi:ribonuclease HI